MLEKLKDRFKWVEKVTVEPATFLYVMAVSLQGPSENMFFYNRYCTVIFNDTWTCNNLHNETMGEAEVKVQRLASMWGLYAYYFQSVPPLIMTFVYGIVSDRYSRKLVMTLPLLGSALESVIYILMAAFPKLPLPLMVVGKFLVGIGGGWTTFFMGMMSYISSITTEEERTSRIAIGNGSFSIALAVSLLVGGLILEATSFLFIFLLALGLQFLGILYIIVVVKDVKSPKKKKEQVDDSITRSRRISAVSNQGKNVDLALSATSLAEQEDSFNLKSALANLVRKRENNGRAHLFILLPMFFLILFGNMPTYVNLFLFIKRQPLSWSQALYGYFMGYQNILRSIALMVVLPIMKRYKVRETIILCAAFASAMASQVLLGFSTLTWMVFVAALIGFLSDSMYVTSRAMVSFILEPKEVGQMFAIIGTIQGLGELIGVSIYNTLYRVTLTIWAGFVFVFGAAIFLIPLGMTIWLHIDFVRRDLYQPGSMGKESKDEDMPKIKAHLIDEKEKPDFVSTL